MAAPGSVAQQIAGTGIFNGEQLTGDPITFKPQADPLVKTLGMFRLTGQSARVGLQGIMRKYPPPPQGSPRLLTGGRRYPPRRSPPPTVGGLAREGRKSLASIARPSKRTVGDEGLEPPTSRM